MGAAARRSELSPATAPRESPVRPARTDDSPVAPYVHRQRALLESAFGPPGSDESYPGPLKLVILIGAPVAIWSIVFAGAAAVAGVLIH